METPDGCCAYCGRRTNNIKGHQHEFTIDHTIPRANRANNYCLNRLPACRSCNEWKKDDTIEYWLTQIQARQKANIGSSKCSQRRWDHMEKQVKLIIGMLPQFKDKIFSLSPSIREKNRYIYSNNAK